MGQTVKVVIIDSGIYSKGYLSEKVITKIDFIGENQDLTHDRIAVVHGTTCAEIISQICPQVQFLDLTAMHLDGTARMSKLLEALDWCIVNKIKLIHLSLGTVNYFDIKPLEEKIRTLTDQNAIIVAAYHNHNIRTYPAVFPRVLGVRQDRNGVLKEYEFLFQEQEGYGCENLIVAHWWGEAAENRANSYAAPVITGYVAKVLTEHGEADFVYIMEALKRRAVCSKKYPNQVKNVIETSGNINIPVIAGKQLDHGEMRELSELFENKGYYALLLGERQADTCAIPLEYYGGKDISLSHILHTVNMAYMPDIILLDFDSGQLYDATKEVEIDVCVSYNCGTYHITAENMSKRTRRLEEAFDIIFQCFA